MRLRVFRLAVLWAVSLVGVGVWAQGTPTEPDRRFFVKPGEPFGPVLTGSDIGFQRVLIDMTYADQSKIPGRWLVRVNGEWRETASASAWLFVQPAR